jgi:S-(hydroxymethyl)glutathione dehydrogenase/alcohol dehydrogenase
MKAAILYKANTPLEVVDVQQQGPQGGEARVRVKAAGVCHSDWHIINGDWTLPLPMVLGHEAAGIVEEVGAGVGNVKPGDHVIFSFRPQCGRCLYCSIGRSILCDGHQTARWAMLDGTCRLKRDGQDIFQMARIGTFAESVVCPAEMLVPIRQEMPWPQAALMGCCVPTGVGAVTRCAEVEAGASVVVIGCGGVGLNVVQGARLAGAKRIVAIDTNPLKLELAGQFGATDVIRVDETPMVDEIARVVPGGVDYAFEVVGQPELLAQTFELTRPGGTCVAVGSMPPGATIPVRGAALFMERRLVGCVGGSNVPERDIPRIVDLYRAGKIRLDELIGKRVALADFASGIAASEGGEVARSVVTIPA